MGLTYTLDVEEDKETGEFLITFPPEILTELGWNDGDILEWDIKDDGTAILSKKNHGELAE